MRKGPDGGWYATYSLTSLGKEVASTPGALPSRYDPYETGGVNVRDILAFLQNNPGAILDEVADETCDSDIIEASYGLRFLKQAGLVKSR